MNKTRTKDSLRTTKTLDDAELRAKEQEFENESEQWVGEDQGHGVCDLQEAALQCINKKTILKWKFDS